MNTLRLIVPVLVSFVGVAVALGQDATKEGAGKAGPQIPRVGELSPALGFEELMNAPDGTEATLESLRGKVVVLEFWATWCGPCVGAIPHINELRQEFIDEDIVFISVTAEDRETVQKFQDAGRPKIDGWIALDTDKSLFKTYGVRGIPHTVVLDGYGRVAAITDPRELDEDRIKAFLSGHRDIPLDVAASEDRARAREQGLHEIAATAGAVGAVRSVEPRADFYLVMGADPLKGANGSGAMSSGHELTFSGHARKALLGAVLETDPDLIEYDGLDGDSETKYYDLSLWRKNGLEPGDRDLMRDFVLASFDVQVREEERELDGYKLVQLESGHKLPEPFEKSAGFRSGLELDAVRGSTGLIASWAKGMAKAPVDDATGLGDERFRLKLGPLDSWDIESLQKTLREQAGLQLVPAKVTRTVMVVSPRSKDQAAAN
jgi:thiol-disulfide isomerase/thioredoxin